MTQVKGTAIQSSLRYVRERFGAPALEGVLRARLHGWMHRTLERTGAKNLRSRHSSCVHRGDPVCRFEGTWGPRG